MKLPKDKDKLMVTDRDSRFYGCVVSGVHLEVRSDEYDNPDEFWYYVCVDRVCGERVSPIGSTYASYTLEGALDYVTRYFTPYNEQEENSDEKAAVGEAAGAAEVKDMEGTGRSVGFLGYLPAGSAGTGSGTFLFAGMLLVEAPVSSAASSSADGCLRRNPIARLIHMFDSFNSLAADLLHMQYLLAPVLPGTGGAAYA